MITAEILFSTPTSTETSTPTTSTPTSTPSTTASSSTNPWCDSCNQHQSLDHCIGAASCWWSFADNQCRQQTCFDIRSSSLCEATAACFLVNGRCQAATGFRPCGSFLNISACPPRCTYNAELFACHAPDAVPCGRLSNITACTPAHCEWSDERQHCRKIRSTRPCVLTPTPLVPTPGTTTTERPMSTASAMSPTAPTPTQLVDCPAGSFLQGGTCSSLPDGDEAAQNLVVSTITAVLQDVIKDIDNFVDRVDRLLLSVPTASLSPRPQ